MQRNDEFSYFHPIVNFIYFISVLILSVYMMNPVCILISFTVSVLYGAYLRGAEFFKLFRITLPMAVFTVVINPLFNHGGATILRYMPSGNPLTFESIIFGVAAGAMLLCVTAWFSSYNRVMTSDKFVYLFGRIIPTLSLIFSMALRFVPRFSAQLKTVVREQQSIMGYGILNTIKTGALAVSIMISWSLESAVEMSDSMRGRGYGLKGRTAFSIYKFEKRDALVFALMIICIAYIVLGRAIGAVAFTYFPIITGNFDFYSMTVFAAFLVLTLLPIIINLWEDIKWKSL